MRTTLTLDPDVAERLRQEAALGKRSFKELVNDALARGLGLKKEAPKAPYRVKTHTSPFVPGLDPSRLNQFVDELEAEAFVPDLAGKGLP